MLFFLEAYISQAAEGEASLSHPAKCCGFWKKSSEINSYLNLVLGSAIDLVLGSAIDLVLGSAKV